jgi:hypothetical protein
MNRRITTLQRPLVLGCVLALLAATMARGEGSIEFNGTATSGTSKLRIRQPMF